MPRYNEKRLEYSDQEKLLKLLCKILFHLDSEREILDFLKDLLNRKERLMIVRRLLIAEMLFNGVPYRDIMSQLHCGCATIARVERWLDFGRGGYKKAIKCKTKKLIKQSLA